MKRIVNAPQGNARGRASAAFPASTYHAFCHAEDLPDLEVKSSLRDALEARDSVARDLEEAFVTAILVDRFSGPDTEASAGAATDRLIEARLLHSAAILKLANLWSRWCGANITPSPRIVEAKAKAIEARMQAADTARRVAAQAARDRAFNESMATMQPASSVTAEQIAARADTAVRRVRPTASRGASSPTTEPRVSSEKVGLDAEM